MSGDQPLSPSVTQTIMTLIPRSPDGDIWGVLEPITNTNGYREDGGPTSPDQKSKRSDRAATAAGQARPNRADEPKIIDLTPREGRHEEDDQEATEDEEDAHKDPGDELVEPSAVDVSHAVGYGDEGGDAKESFARSAIVRESTEDRTILPFAMSGGSWAAMRAAGVVENMMKRRSMLTTLVSGGAPDEVAPSAGEAKPTEATDVRRDVVAAPAAVSNPSSEATAEERPRREKRRRRASLGGLCPVPTHAAGLALLLSRAKPAHRSQRGP